MSDHRSVVTRFGVDNDQLVNERNLFDELAAQSRASFWAGTTTLTVVSPFSSAKRRRDHCSPVEVLVANHSSTANVTPYRAR